MQRDKVLSILRIVFLNNGYWKLLSLVIAVLVYFSIRAEISHVRVISIPVEAEFDAAGAGAAIESVEPRSVQVTLRGSYTDVNQLSLSVARCVVRPRQKKGNLVDSVPVKIRRGNLRGVRGIRVVKVDPNVAVVKFDVPMSLPLMIARPAEIGTARGRVQLVYDLTNAVVRGSRRQLSTLNPEVTQIQTEPINVDGRSQTFSTRVRLLPPGDVVNATVEPPEMVVQVQILSEKATAKLERVPVVVYPHDMVQRWHVEPECVEVELSGRGEIIKAVTPEQVTAVVSGNLPLSRETNGVPVMIHLQQGLEVSEVRALPPTVRLIPVTASVVGADTPAGQK